MLAHKEGFQIEDISNINTHSEVDVCNTPQILMLIIYNLNRD